MSELIPTMSVSCCMQQPQAASLSLKGGTSSDSETPNAEIRMPGQYESKDKQTVLPVSTPEPVAGQVQSRRASYKAQAGALFRKNAVYQRRNWCSNVCLLSAPIFFCLLLFGIQIAINKLLLSGEDYEVCFAAGASWRPLSSWSNQAARNH